MREITEIAEFSSDEIEAALKMLARMRIIGSYYEGHINKNQQVEYLPNDVIRIITKHTPSSRVTLGTA